MRIASLNTATTEWIVKLGRADWLVAPPWRPLDVDTTEALTRTVSVGEVAALEPQVPDLVVVAEADAGALNAALAAWTTPPEVMVSAPRTLKQVLEGVLRLARRLDASKEAMAFLGRQEVQLEGMRRRIGVARRTPADALPTVACLSSLHPPVAPCRWVPDLVAMAGGRALHATPGEPDRILGMDELLEADPDVLLVCLPGEGVHAGLDAIASVRNEAPWNGLRAVRNRRLFALAGDTYLHRPGPSLYRAIELIAQALYPSAALEVPPADWEMKRA